MRTPIGEMWVEDGVLWHRLDRDVSVGEGDVERVKQVISTITGGEPMPAVVDIRGVAYANRNVRDAFGGDAGPDTATALIIGSSSSRAMASAYISLSKPHHPVATFTTEAEAMSWLAEVTRGAPDDGDRQAP